MTRHPGGRFLPPDDRYIGPTAVARRLNVTKKTVRDMLENEVLPCIKDKHGNHWCEIVIVDAFARTRAEEALKKWEDALARKARKLEREAKALAKARRLAAPPVAASDDLYDDPGIAPLPDTRDEIPSIPVFPARAPVSREAHAAVPPLRPTDSAGQGQSGAPPRSSGGLTDEGRRKSPLEQSHSQTPATNSTRFPPAAHQSIRRMDGGRSDGRPHPLLAPVARPLVGQRPALNGTENHPSPEAYKGWVLQEDGTFDTLEDQERRLQSEDRQRAQEQERAEGSGPGLVKTHRHETSESESDVADEPPPSRRTG